MLFLIKGLDRRTDGQTEGLTDRRTAGWTEEWTAIPKVPYSASLGLLLTLTSSEQALYTQTNLSPVSDFSLYNLVSNITSQAGRCECAVRRVTRILGSPIF